jgi:hypothetical protein
LPTPAFGLSDQQPVGGPVTGSAEAAAVDKGFQQFDGMAVLALPIRSDACGDTAEQMTGQVGSQFGNPGCTSVSEIGQDVADESRPEDSQWRQEMTAERIFTKLMLNHITEVIDTINSFHSRPAPLPKGHGTLFRTAVSSNKSAEVMGVPLRSTPITDLDVGDAFLKSSR